MSAPIVRVVRTWDDGVSELEVTFPDGHTEIAWSDDDGDEARFDIRDAFAEYPDADEVSS